MKTVLSVVLALFLAGCGEEVPKQVQQVKQELQKPTKALKPVKEKRPTTIQRTIAPSPMKTGKKIYKKCAGCHGADGSTKALGKSQVIKGWSAAKAEDALNGYRDGTYGGDMKTLMKGQVSNLSDSDIKLVSDYISKL